ncbi:hypothetical protein PVAP13_9KG422033 [Panicum virgatum]|uniref:Secreted protein n=1 Tax=Panicum virgatum TaxID=38727 RepID=A0A8T0P0P6_PANVG|nr:hypothetical protein PVAP13_9KG422033 [Panicum virgatum]
MCVLCSILWSTSVHAECKLCFDRPLDKARRHSPTVGQGRRADESASLKPLFELHLLSVESGLNYSNRPANVGARRFSATGRRRGAMQGR